MIKFRNCSTHFVTRFLDTFGKTVTSVMISYSNYSENSSNMTLDVNTKFPNLQHLVLDGCQKQFSHLITNQLKTLIVLRCDFNITSIPMLKNLTILHVDKYSVDILSKCSNNIVMLFTSGYFWNDEDIPVNIVCPNLKHFFYSELRFKEFMQNHNSSLETIVLQGDKVSVSFNLNCGNFPSLKRLLIPHNCIEKVKNESGSVDIYYNNKTSVIKYVIESLSNDFDYQLYKLLFNVFD